MTKNTAKGKKKVQATKKQVEQKSEPGLNEKHPILSISLNMLLLSLIVISSIYILDHKGLFDPDQKNNHTKKKWDAFYEFTKENNVDVLLVGNSHLYTGINPKNLSVELNANAFILASPGTHMGDSYFALKDALRKCKPKVVVLETYGAKEFDPYKLSDGMLSDQLKSYSARKSFGVKLFSTPSLFNTSNYLSAWSNAIRNHDFLYTNKEQLQKNKKLIKEKDKKKKNELYLGRYVRFTSGIKEDILKKYKEEGGPVDGKDYVWNEYTEKYIDKIVQLCKNKDIELVFLTLPMYHAHIEDYSVWKNKLGEILYKHPNTWLDMQEPYAYSEFTEICFENSYNTNQHMTYQGSLVATYKLAEVIKDIDVELPNRAQERSWHQLFYGQEGYFQNFTPVEDDPKNKLLAKDQQFGALKVKEVSFLNTHEKQPLLQAKIERNIFKNIAPESTSVQLLVEYKSKDQILRGVIPVKYDRFHKTEKYAIYAQKLNSVEILKILEVKLLDNSRTARNNGASEKK